MYKKHDNNNTLFTQIYNIIWAYNRYIMYQGIVNVKIKKLTIEKSEKICIIRCGQKSFCYTVIQM